MPTVPFYLMKYSQNANCSLLRLSLETLRVQRFKIPLENPKNILFLVHSNLNIVDALYLELVLKSLYQIPVFEQFPQSYSVCFVK